jgi:Tfp pilus assembly protein PilP
MRGLVLAVVFASSVVAAQAQAPAKPTPPASPAAAQPAAQKPGVPATPPPAAPAQPPAAGQAQPAGQPQPPKAAGEGYTYEPDNRRDPFISLVGTGIETTVVKKGEGPAGMLVSEISVRGIMQSKGAYVAMVEGPDKKTYVVHSGDRLADGTIKSIIPTGLVITQEVNDPLSLVKQREVRKLLRSLEDAK